MGGKLGIGWVCMHPCATCLIWAALAMQSAFADAVPEQGGADPRIRVATYASDEVYPLRGFAGYQIDLQFEAGETFVGLGAGDMESLTFAAQSNHLFLKPKASGISTNLTVLTSRRAYHFDYTATTRHPNPDDGDVVYVLRFTYAPAPSSGQDAADVGRKLADDDRASRNFDYWYRGSQGLRPVAAWDDGVHTHLQFGSQQELPAIFLRNEDGSESLVNVTVSGTGVVVHRISRHLYLRRGRLTGCIVNAAFDKAPEHTLSGTVTPLVERVAKGTER